MSTALVIKGGLKVSVTVVIKFCSSASADFEAFVALSLRPRVSSRRKWLPPTILASTTAVREHAATMAAKSERNFVLGRMIIIVRLVVVVVVVAKRFRWVVLFVLIH